MVGSGAQIPLPFKAAERISFDSFWGGANLDLVQQLRQVASGKSNRNIFLWGETGCGKTHLLHACCNEASQQARPAAFVPMSQVPDLSPAMLEGLESLALVCLDDLDRVAGDAQWEHAVFSLFNRLRDSGIPLLMSSRVGPRGIPVHLPDLASRLGWDLVYRVTPLDEPSRLRALQKRAALRGMELPDEVLEFLSRRLPRDVHTLFEWLDRLDEATLSAKKRLTVPFVRDLLGS